jgi:monoterpene epsilon-lactone hydrolase
MKNTTAEKPPRQSLRARVLRHATRLLLRPILSGDDAAPQQRARLNRVAKLTQLLLPRGTLISQQTLGGVPAEWVESLRSGVQGYLLYLHGGAYAIGSPQVYRNLAAQLARRCAMRVITIDYRLAPEHPFPAARDDALAAYRGLLDLGVAPQDIIIAGDSAGGGLTLACALAIREAGLPLPAGLICLSPWTDLTGSGDSMSRNAGTEVILSPAKIAVYASWYLNGADPRSPQASPLFADLKGLPPLLIQVADIEILFDDATRLAAAAKRAGVDTKLQVSPGLWHVWQLYAGQLPEADDALRRIAHFVSAHLGKS